MLELRRATPADAPDIAHLMQIVWPDDTASASAIASLIEAGDRCTLLVVDGRRLAGFCDAFATTAGDGATRWEIDLLAVHPAFRGRGLARSLIHAATVEGRERGLAYARGLVRTDNQPVRRAFAAAGYAASTQAQRLYVLTAPPTADETANDTGNIISVRTFAYYGVWIEGEINGQTVAAAARACARNGGWIIGAVIPAEATGAMAAAERHGFSPIGDYHWWEQSITTGAAPARR